MTRELRRIVLLGLGLGLVSAVLSLLLRSDGRSSTSADRRPEEPTARHPSALEEPRATADQSGAGTRREQAPERDAPTVESGGLVACVEDAEGHLVAGADVHVFDNGLLDALAQREELARSDGDQRRRAMRLATFARTDASGRARFPDSTGLTWIGAEHDGAWAESSVWPEVEEVRLRLGPDRVLAVRVVDPRGEGVASVLVAVRSRTSCTRSPSTCAAAHASC